MRVFICAVCAAIALGAGAHFALNSIQQSVAAADTTGSARLDQQEIVSDIGREG